MRSVRGTICLVAVALWIAESFAGQYLLKQPTGDRSWSVWQTAPYVCRPEQGDVCNAAGGNFWVGVSRFWSAAQSQHLDSLGIRYGWYRDVNGVAYYQFFVDTGLSSLYSWLKQQLNFLNLFPMRWGEKVEQRLLQTPWEGEKKLSLHFWDKQPLNRLPPGFDWEEELSGEKFVWEVQSGQFRIPESLVSRIRAPSRPRLSFVVSTSHAKWQHTFVLKKLAISEVNDGGLPQISCTGLPIWQNNTHVGGDRIQYAQEVYECIPGVTSPWCKLSGYAPGGLYWGQAWRKVARCL